ncbi:MAG: SdrD B-like domain-containing protein [Planctomycetota bacterium]
MAISNNGVISVTSQANSISVIAVSPVTVPVITAPVDGAVILTGRPVLSGNAGVTNAGNTIKAEVNVETSGNQLFDFNAGSAIVQADGSFSITISPTLVAALPSGNRYLTVTCAGVTSAIIRMVIVDPFGVLFDSRTNQPIDGVTVTLERYITETGVWQNAALGTDIAGPAGVANPQTSGWTGTLGQYQYDNNIGTYAYKRLRLKVTAPGYTFPSTKTSFPGWGRVIYTDNVGTYQSGENVSLGGQLWLEVEPPVNADIPLDPGKTLLKITKKTNKKEVSIGDIITYEVTVENENKWTVGAVTSPVYIMDILPPGFKYIDESTSLKIGAAAAFTKIANPAGGRTRLFNIGQVAGNSKTILRYQLVVGAGVTFGEYKNLAQAVYGDGFVISNDAQRKVMVVPDPVFDYSTIIGKVFNDKNRNGVQDAGEIGVKGVKIATEDGILITTDQDGKYHIAGIEPYTKLIKLDENSLPLGSRLTTTNPKVVRFTLGGNLAKVNFGIHLPSTSVEVGPRGEVVMPVEVGVKPEMTVRIGGQLIPLQWTQPFEEKALDETEALRLQVEKWRTESDTLRAQSEEKAGRSASLKALADKETKEGLRVTLLKSSGKLQQESESLAQQAKELADKAEVESAKIQSESDALKITIDELTEKAQDLNRQSEELKQESEDYRATAESVRETDKSTAETLLEESRQKKEESQARRNEAQQLNKEIAKLNEELGKQKVFAKKRRGEPQVKINGQLLKIDAEKGYQGDLALSLDTNKIDIWARDARSREAKWVKAISVPQLQVSVYRSDEPAVLAPNLMVALTPEMLEIKTGRLERAAQFIIKSNYAQFLEQWKLEIFAPEEPEKIGRNDNVGTNSIRALAGSDDLETESDPEGALSDETEKPASDTDDSLQPSLATLTTTPPEGYRLFKEFSGRHQDINKPITWNGRGDNGQLVIPDSTYRYRLSVQDRYGEIDRTKEGQFMVVSTWAKKIRDALGISPAVQEEQLGTIPAMGFDEKNIQVKGRVYRISGTTNKGNKINVSTPNVTEMILVTPLEDGTFESEVYVPMTEDTLWVEAVIPEGYLRFRLAEDIKVPEEKSKQPFFLNLLADGEYGSNTVSGNNAAVEHQPRLDDGTYFQGRLAYYLKKQWGRYDITSSLDTDRYKNQYQKPLFKYIDPDKFYPVYGDNSTRVDDATGTQGKFYLKMAKGESYGLWGSYGTGFTGTELAQYNRSLYGAKFNYQPLAASYLPQTTIFAANALQLASHDELRGTGGSLYYLKYKNVVSGSEKIAVEVRDKISGLTVSSKVMTEGQDYEIDYDQGRIIFYKPVPSVDNGTNTIISTDLLDGNHVYVVVNYEYQPDSRDRKTSSGIRLIKNLGSGFDLGVTSVKEDKELEDYTLTGSDLKLKLGSASILTAEFASSKSESVRGNISYSGGFDYTSLPTAETNDGSAYKIYLSSDLGSVFSSKAGDVRFNLTYQKIEAGFSSGQSIFSQGTNKISADITAKMSKHDNLLLRFDDQKLLDNGNAASRTQTGADKNQSLTAQLTHTKDQMTITGEFRQQKTTAPVSSPLLEDDTAQFLAARADYKVNKKLSVFGEGQGALSGEPANHQYSVGANALLNERMAGNAKFTFGELGNAAVLGLTSKVNDRTSLYTNYQITEDTAGQKSYTTVFGESTQVNSRARIYREERFQGRRGAEDGLYGGVFGADYALTDKWAVVSSYERSQIDTDTTQTTRDAFALGATFNSHPKAQDPTRVAGYTKFTTRAEYRSEEGGTDRTSYLTANKLFYQVNPDVNLLAKAYYSKTQNETTDTKEAEFTEGSIGLAYRPVKNDKHNLLGKITYQSDQSPPVQGDLQTLLRKAMIFSTESAIDLPSGFQIINKLAYKQQKEETGAVGEITSDTYLIALRGNYKLKSDSIWLDKWLMGLEYRIKAVKLAEDKKSGVVLEFERELHQRINFGFGYNFTDFTDELSVYDDDYDVKGWFVRLTAKY